MYFSEGKMEFRFCKFWIEVFVEFLVIFLFLFMVCGIVLLWNNILLFVIYIVFSYGLSIVILVMVVFYILGG